MAKPVVNGFQGCSFKGIDLSKNLTEWRDTRQQSLAPHRYIKKDGAEVEVLGRKPHQVKAMLAYAGSSWRADWLPLAASLDQDPSGLLVHPVYGQMPAVCEGYQDAAMNVELAANLYIVPLTFIENQLGAAVQSQTSGPRAIQERTEAHGAALLQRAAKQGRVANNIGRYVTTALGYAQAAADQTEQALSYGRLLESQLAQVELGAASAREAIRADPTTGDDAARYEMFALIELLYDDCVQLDGAVRTTRAPALIVYEVPSMTQIAALAVRFYGPGGLSRIDEILANNSGFIPNPAAIAPGTLLTLAPPTV